MADKVSKDKVLRQRLIGKLNIPTYNQVKQVMFYDVLQQLCDKINLVKFNEKHLKQSSAQRNVLAKFGMAPSATDEISVIFAKDNKTGVDFEKAIRNMGRLNPKVKLITLL